VVARAALAPDVEVPAWWFQVPAFVIQISRFQARTCLPWPFIGEDLTPL